jgi:hypothetical protein
MPSVTTVKYLLNAARSATLAVADRYGRSLVLVQDESANRHLHLCTNRNSSCIQHQHQHHADQAPSNDEEDRRRNDREESFHCLFR